MKINPDGRTLGGLSTFLAFVALNLMYLVACVPIITIGAATSALYEVTIRFSDEESGRPVRDFFPAFVRNFARATLLAAAFLIPFVAFVFSAVFWSAHSLTIAWGLMIVSILAAGYTLCAFLWAMALVARVDDPFRRTFKNAVLLPGGAPARSLGVLLIPVTLACIAILFPPFTIILGTIGFSVGAYATAFIFRSTFNRLALPDAGE